MPRATPLTPLGLAVVAAAGGVGWGIVMALVAWHRVGTEIVLLQGWILVPAWLFGRAAGAPRAGALAGFAVVAAAVWTYELLPGWGLEAAIRRENPAPEELDRFVAGFDADDIVLFSTLAIGALLGLGGSLGRKGEGPAPPAPDPQPEPLPAPPPPLWARFERPQSPAPGTAVPPPPPPRDPRPAPAGTPWASAFLMAAFATDVCLDRLFGMYTSHQGAVALAFMVAGGVATAWLARRYAIAMVAAGAVLASAFAAVQHAEYHERAGPEIAIVR